MLGLSVEIGKDSNLFPKLLREIDGCPERLYCLGDVDLLSRDCLAVVGSRLMTDYGRRVVRRLIPILSKKYIIVSGMAFGVDAEVHRVCVESGGKTIAVLASGVNVPSPQSNRWVYELILKNGGLITSEWGEDTRPRKESFVRRNRIISGICRGVVVVEGGKHSGTLATARLAAEQGREVWAVPGRVDDTNSWATNYLI